MGGDGRGKMQKVQWACDEEVRNRLEWAVLGLAWLGKRLGGKDWGWLDVGCEWVTTWTDRAVLGKGEMGGDCVRTEGHEGLQ